jgi:hypothetical protein
MGDENSLDFRIFFVMNHTSKDATNPLTLPYWWREQETECLGTCDHPQRTFDLRSLTEIL